MSNGYALSFPYLAGILLTDTLCFQLVLLAQVCSATIRF